MLLIQHFYVIFKSFYSPTISILILTRHNYIKEVIWWWEACVLAHGVKTLVCVLSLHFYYLFYNPGLAYIYCYLCIIHSLIPDVYISQKHINTKPCTNLILQWHSKMTNQFVSLDACICPFKIDIFSAHCTRRSLSSTKTSHMD